MTDDRQLPIQPDPGPSADPEPGPPPAEPASGRRQTPATPPLPPPTRREPSSADERPRRPEYRGEELDPERGPGLGCFWFQVIVLGFFIVIIPVGLNLNWPFEVLAILLFVVIGLLLLTGQTVIFLLRLVAADRRSAGRRRPLASTTKTVGEMEDELGAVEGKVGGAGTTPAAPPLAPAAPGLGHDPVVDRESVVPAEPADAASPAEAPDAPEIAPEIAPDEPAEANDEPAEATDEPGAEPADETPAAEAADEAPAADAAAEPEPPRPEEPDAGVRQ